jgi:hypothetical protein
MYGGTRVEEDLAGDSTNFKTLSN